MDKNRLIQIANHFDKIGAYTISDEFENKFLKLAADPPTIKDRNPDIEKSIGQVPGERANYYLNYAKDWIKNLSPFKGYFEKSRQQFTSNALTTWKAVLVALWNNPKYSVKKTIVRNALQKVVDAESAFNGIKRRDLKAPEVDKELELTILTTQNNPESFLKEFLAFVNGEFNNYKEIPFVPYINSLRNVEDELFNLRNAYIDPTRPPVAPPTATGGGGSGTTGAPSGGAPAAGGGTPAPAGGAPAAAPSGGGGARPSAPSSSGSAGGNATPAAAGGRPQGSSGSAGGGSKTQNKPAKSSLGKVDINEELSKIVFRKLRALKPDVDEKQIFMDMRSDNKYKAYLEISKSRDLKGSIIAAINASKFSNDDKTKLINKLDKKIQDAIDLNKPRPSDSASGQGPSGQVASGPGAAGLGSTVNLTPDERVKEEAKKFNTFNFTCSREGLDLELKRMDKLFEEDRDKFMNNFLSDIKRVIDCHSVLRNSLPLKDNTNFDVFINDLERKYFAYTFRKDLPY